VSSPSNDPEARTDSEAISASHGACPRTRLRNAQDHRGPRRALSLTLDPDRELALRVGLGAERERSGYRLEGGLGDGDLDRAVIVRDLSKADFLGAGRCLAVAALCACRRSGGAGRGYGGS